MSFRQFDNPNSLPLSVMQARIINADANAIVSVYTIQIRDPITLQVTGTRQYVNVDSILTDAQITNGLAIPTTPAELAAILRGSSAKANAKLIPNWVSWDETTALAYLDTNITVPLATPIPANPMTVQQIRAVLVTIVQVMGVMNTILQAFARLLIAMRNDRWLDLQDTPIQLPAQQQPKP